MRERKKDGKNEGGEEGRREGGREGGTEKGREGLFSTLLLIHPPAPFSKLMMPLERHTFFPLPPFPYLFARRHMMTGAQRLPGTIRA